MRKQISKAITRRGAAVRVALDKYNALAALQDPPRPHLEYSAVADYGWLGDFELLKWSRHEVAQKPWANTAYRDVAAKHFKVLRAHEEVVRLNVEIRRLQTWVDDEDTFLLTHARNLSETDPVLGARVYDIYLRRHRVNNIHRARLRSIYALPGYNGHTTPGIRLGRMDIPSVGIQEEGFSELAGIESDDEEIDIADDDLVNDEVLRLGDLLNSTHM